VRPTRILTFALVLIVLIFPMNYRNAFVRGTDLRSICLNLTLKPRSYAVHGVVESITKACREPLLVSLVETTQGVPFSFQVS
jgi:hypothetical protein